MAWHFPRHRIRSTTMSGSPNPSRPPDHPNAAAPAETLSRGLKQRHLTMIAIGGVIGAGLFVGSGVVIANTGPSAFLGYAVTCLLYTSPSPRDGLLSRMPSSP